MSQQWGREEIYGGGSNSHRQDGILQKGRLPENMSRYGRDNRISTGGKHFKAAMASTGCIDPFLCNYHNSRTLLVSSFYIRLN